MNFEWDARKNASNIAKHGVSLEEAKAAFDDPHAVVAFDPGTQHAKGAALVASWQGSRTGHARPLHAKAVGYHPHYRCGILADWEGNL